MEHLGGKVVNLMATTVVATLAASGRDRVAVFLVVTALSVALLCVLLGRLASDDE
jgi:hypothetical protein